MNSLQQLDPTSDNLHQSARSSQYLNLPLPSHKPTKSLKELIGPSAHPKALSNPTTPAGSKASRILNQTGSSILGVRKSMILGDDHGTILDANPRSERPEYIFGEKLKEFSQKSSTNREFPYPRGYTKPPLSKMAGDILDNLKEQLSATPKGIRNLHSLDKSNDTTLRRASFLSMPHDFTVKTRMSASVSLSSTPDGEKAKIRKPSLFNFHIDENKKLVQNNSLNQSELKNEKEMPVESILPKDKKREILKKKNLLVKRNMKTEIKRYDF